MGNALTFLYGRCCSATPESGGSLGHHGVTPATVGVSALAQDLYNFEITSQVKAFHFSHQLYYDLSLPMISWTQGCFSGL